MITTLACLLLAQTQEPDLGVAAFVGILPSGSVVRVLGIENASGNFWAPDGGQLDKEVRKKLSEGRLPSKTQSTSKALVIHFDIKPFDANVDLGMDGKCPGVSGNGFVKWSFWSMRESQREPYRHSGYCYIGEPLGDEAEISIGLAEGSFEVVARSVRMGSAFKSVFGPSHQVALHQIEPSVFDDGTGRNPSPYFKLEGTLPNLDSKDYETRLVLYKKNGKKVDSGGGSSGSSGGSSVDMTYSGLAKEIERVELQRRSYVWIRFKGIRLKPRSQYLLF